jgi:tRNA threonylcarbamoyladenosine biosynthesis protein TsaE
MSGRRAVLSRSAEATWLEARKFGATLRKGDCVALCGPMGAGKTLFVKGLAAGLKIKGPVASPTFSLMNRYPGTFPLYHFDLYRLETEKEVDGLGWEEFLHTDGVAAVEWADKFIGLLPAPYWEVTLEIAGKHARRISYRFWKEGPPR